MGILRLSQAGILSEGKRANFLAGISFFGRGFGYTVGGNNSAGDYVTTVDKFNLTNDSRTTLATGLPDANSYQGTVSDVSKGFVARGLRQGFRAQVYKFVFSTDVFSLLPNGYSGERHFMAGAASTTKGYFMGGSDNAGNQYSSVETIDLAAETLSSLGTGLSSARGGGVGLQSSISGYAAGGRTGNAGPTVTTVDKFAFSNDARTTLSTGLNAASDYGGSVSSGSAGYLIGGNNNNGGVGLLNIIQKVLFSNDVTSTLPVTLAKAQATPGCFGNAIAGYAAGGADATAALSSIEKFIFSVETRNVIATTLSSARNGTSGLSNRG